MNNNGPARRDASTQEPDDDILNAVLEKLGEIARAARRGNFVFRGEPKCYEEISSSLYREYKVSLELFGVDGFDIRHVQDEIIADAASYADGLTREDLISQLQHYGHPTNLIDFTTDYLIAVFFACSSEPNEDGRVILLNTASNSPFRLRSPANRVKAQKSVFVNPPSGVVTPEQTILIPRDLKLPILDYLRDFHDISTNTIYDDIHGYIKNSNIHRSAYTEFHIAGLYLNQGNHREALKHYNRSIELNGHQKESYANRAVTFVRIGKHNEAIRDFTQVIALDPQDARAYRERGQVFFDSGQPGLAEKDFSKAIRIDKRMEDAYIGRAACRVYSTDFDGAIEDLNFVIELNPENHAAYNGRVCAFGAIGNSQLALRDLETAIKLDPTDPVPFMSRALVNLDTGEHKDAISDLDMFIRLGGDDLSAAHFRRGISQIALGNYEEARADLRTAHDLDPYIANRVVKSTSDVRDGSEHIVFDDDVPKDILEMLKPRLFG